MRKIKKIIVHHTGDSSGLDQFVKIERHHKSRKYPESASGYYCGYHFLIEKTGKVIQAHPTEEIGAHDKGENDSIGIGLAGNFNKQNPNAKQVKALGKLLAMLVPVHGLKEKDIEPHRVNDNTDCFGTRLSNDWAEVVYRAYVASNK